MVGNQVSRARTSSRGQQNTQMWFEDRYQGRDRRQIEGRTGGRDRRQIEGRSVGRDRRQIEGRSVGRDRRQIEGRSVGRDRRQIEGRSVGRDRRQIEARNGGSRGQRERGTGIDARYCRGSREQGGRIRAVEKAGKRRRQRGKHLFLGVVGLALCMWMAVTVKEGLRAFSGSLNTPQAQGSAGAAGYDVLQSVETGTSDFGEAAEILNELLEKNEETLEYVRSYPDREEYMGRPIDLTEDFVSGEVPLLMQWDRRWGYDSYGREMIGLAGCGPLCMEMAYLYFTEDTDMTPRNMADFAYDNGFYTEQGTSWSLWTEGAARLGLEGTELPLDEKMMKNTLDSGNLIVCSMRPGDFTTTGHFILIRGYDEDGFLVNDPNRRSTSGKTWSYEELQYQIRNLWSLGKG